VLADAGYWHGEQIDRLMGQGVQVLIPPDADTRRGTRPGWDGGRYAFMRNVLDTPAAGELYAQRQQMIEPVFADTKFNRRADRSYAAAEPPPARNGGRSPPPETS
jgi:hypothetical protein